MDFLFKNKSDFEFFFKENYLPLCRMARAYFKNEELVEEIVCETFLKLWNNRETILIKTSINDYLNKSLINTCIDYYRREKLYWEKTTHIDDNTVVCQTLADLDENPLDYIVTNERREIIHAAINQLPDRYRTTLMLSRIEGLSYDEIATKMNISKNTVKSNLRDAMRILREKLKYLVVLILLNISLFSFLC